MKGSFKKEFIKKTVLLFYIKACNKQKCKQYIYRLFVILFFRSRQAQMKESLSMGHILPPPVSKSETTIAGLESTAKG
jgi:hypothetical protein